jgi:ABC-type Fe3+-siderophore transport system permease subunit
MSEGAALAAAFLGIISVVALCIVVARRWGRLAQIAVLLVGIATSMAWLLDVIR